LDTWGVKPSGVWAATRLKAGRRANREVRRIGTIVNAAVEMVRIIKVQEMARSIKVLGFRV